MAGSPANGGMIQAIDVNTVHRICSGQVVLTLAVAVKELVENSLDSGATAIDVRLKEFGSETVEVTDNGSGISPSNFESLCLKHYTSKIDKFEDLLDVGTFGFRGEALSSLCALSTVTVTTCEKGSSLGWRLEYDHHGKLARQTQYSRQAGTTVTLCNLFSSLPVRHKEFIKNLRREFTKMTNMLTGYCLISKGTRITCTNMTGGKLSTVLSTRGGTNLKDNFTLVFGLKSWQSMLEFKTVKPSEEVLAEFNLSLDTVGESETLLENWPFQLEGFVSSCSHGQGRSCSDRQYYFINGRPCDPTRVSKLINEIYRTYNRHQQPCVVLNITTRAREVDINVTPDKRQLMINNENLLLATVKASVMELYQDVPSTFTLQNTSILSHTSVMETGSPTSFSSQSSPRLRASLASFAASGSSWTPKSSPGEKRKSTSSLPVPKQKRLDDFVMHPVTSTPGQGGAASRSPEVITLSVPPDSPKKDEVTIESEEEEPEVKVIETAEELENALEDILSDAPQDPLPPSLPAPAESVCISNKAKITVSFNLDVLRQSVASELEASSSRSEECKRFMARISPENAEAAEAELSRQISQSDFEKMEVVGQFNLGFIIARLSSDLFIVDQHAADEKYNFEMLQRTTRLQPQKLVCPKPLNLTAANECMLMDHADIFRRNGFDFIFDKEADATKRVSLSCVPMSGNWLFGPSDVDELLFLLQDSPVNSSAEEDSISEAMMARYRPSRVRAMFASRACRKAVMVGDPLTPAQMKKLLCQLSQLKQPWNCPHGRPTMRHLINMDLLQKN